jgi:hypothetical protein
MDNLKLINKTMLPSKEKRIREQNKGQSED